MVDCILYMTAKCSSKKCIKLYFYPFLCWTALFSGTYEGADQTVRTHFRLFCYYILFVCSSRKHTYIILTPLNPTFTLRKHAYLNTMQISPPKTETFQIKNSNIFLSSAQNIDCGYSLEPPRWGGSNKYPQSMFWAEIRKIMYTPVNPSFTI